MNTVPKANLASQANDKENSEKGKQKIFLSLTTGKETIVKESNDCSENNLSTTFLADSGATEHLTFSKDFLKNFSDVGIHIIKCANRDKSANLITED